MDPFLQMLGSGSGGPQSVTSIVLALLLAFVLGQLLAWVYAWTHAGLSYARSFTQSLVLMTMVVCLIMLVIGNSIVTAFGLLGALALIRFRNVLKDTRDTVFVFMALVIGMAVGTQRFGLAIAGASALMLVTFYLSSTSFGTIGRFDGYLTLRVGGETEANESDYRPVLDRFCRAVKPVSTRQQGDGAESEFVYQIGLRDRDRSTDMLSALRALAGVHHVSLVLRNELSEV